MALTSRITVDEAARRLSVPVETVHEYVRHGKLETIGSGDNLRIIWPETDPAHELYPRSRPPAEELIQANGHTLKTGDFPDEQIQAVTNNARDPGWLVPLVFFLWIFLFLVGGVFLFYVLRTDPVLPSASITRS